MRKTKHISKNRPSPFRNIKQNGLLQVKETSGRSTLTFLTSAPSAESADLSQLRRVRRPVSRSKTGVQGKVADVFFGRSRHAESLNELHGFRILLATAHADSWQEQPFLLEYHRDGQMRHYTPDILVVWGEHREVVDIKEDAEADLPNNRNHFALIHDLLTEHGYHFRIWRKSEIYAQPRLANVGLVLRYRTVEISSLEHEQIRRMFSSKSEVPLHTFPEMGIAIQSALRAVLGGILHIDWWQPLTLTSQVSVVPIGSQVWPSRTPP